MFTSDPPPGMRTGWKLFTAGFDPAFPGAVLPRTLVHGMPCSHRNPHYICARDQCKHPNSKRSRIYPLGLDIVPEPDTKGFNLFKTAKDAIEYLPRFSVRATALLLAPVYYVPSPTQASCSRYTLAVQMRIPQAGWQARITGYECLRGAKPQVEIPRD